MDRWCATAVALANACCREPLPDRRGSCRGYHAVRPFLHVSGLKTAADVYEAMFRAVVQQSTGTKPEPRVLIAGTGDFQVPAIVTQTLQDIGKDPLVTIVDRCRTPLAMCKDAGRRLGMRWETARGDIAAHAPPAAYDLIVSDRLMGFVPPPRRLNLVRAWRNQLAEGGRLITTISVHPASDGSDRDDRALLAAVRDRFDDEYSVLLPGVDRTDLLQMMENYNVQRRGYRIGSAEEVLPLFGQCGFQTLETQTFRKRTESGLPVHSARHILRIVAG